MNEIEIQKQEITGRSIVAIEYEVGDLLYSMASNGKIAESKVMQVRVTLGDQTYIRPDEVWVDYRIAGYWLTLRQANDLYCRTKEELMQKLLEESN